MNFSGGGGGGCGGELIYFNLGSHHQLVPVILAAETAALLKLVSDELLV